MKKVIFSLVFTLLAASGLYANQLTIINLRPCDFYFIFNMDNPSVHSQHVFVPASTTTVFPDGSAVATTWSSPVTPAQMALATFSSVLFVPIDPPPTYYGFLGGTTTTYASSPYAPTCNGTVTYDGSWFGGTNTMVLIF